MKFKHYLLALVALAGIAVGCEKENGGQTGDPQLTATPSTLEFAANGEEMSKTITVTSNKEWKIVEDLDEIGWIRATVGGKSINGEKIPASDTPVTVTITVEDNDSYERSQTLTFNGGTKAKATVTVSQEGNVSYNTIKEVIDLYKGQSQDTLVLADIVIKGIVVSNSTLDNLITSKALYLQDETAGINIFCAANHSFAFGDEVVFDLNGVSVIKYAGTIEITDCPLEVATVKSSGNTVEPEEISVGDMTSGEYEGCYVRINDVQVAASDTLKTWVMNSAATSINMETKDAETFVVRSGKYSSYKDEAVPTGSGYICGLCTTYNGTPQIIFAQDDDRKHLTDDRFESEAPDPSLAEPKTVEEFIDLADRSTYYKLTGTVSSFNSTYCSFDLTDATGKIYVFSVTSESKTEYSSVIKNGGTVTLSGKYSYYDVNSQHEVIDAVILDYEDPESHLVETEKISDVLNASIADTVILKNALVVATAKTSYLVTDTDGEDYILVFQNTEGADTTVNVGDKVKVEAVRAEHNGMAQLDTPATTVLSSGAEVNWPEPENITTTFDSFTSSVVKYISFEGTLSVVSSKYYNVAVEGASNVGSLQASDALTQLIDIPGTTFEGFYLYTSGSTTKYINMMFTKSDAPLTPYLNMDPEGELELSCSATSQEISIKSNTAWTVSSDNGDFSLDVASGANNGTVTVTFPANTDPNNAKVATITVNSEAGEKTLTITQKKYTEAGKYKFVKVSSAPGDWSGTYLAVFTKDKKSYAFDGSKTTDAAGNYVSVTVSGSEIEYSEDLAGKTITLASMEGGYSVKVAGGKYIYGKNNDNKLLFSDSAVAVSVSMADELVTLSSGEKSNFMMYISGDNSRVRFYKSNQTLPSLFKLVEN